MKTIPLIDIIYFVLLFTSLLICLFRMQAIYSIRYVIMLLGVLFFVQLYAEYLNLININNLYLYHILTPVEYSFLSFTFACNVHSAAVRKFLLYSIPVFILLSILLGRLEGISVNNSYASALEGIILIPVALTSLKEMLVFATGTRISQSPFFWFTTGVLFYCVGNLLISGMLNYLIIKDVTVARVLYQVSYVFSYQFFILLIIASYMSEKVKQ